MNINNRRVWSMILIPKKIPCSSDIRISQAARAGGTTLTPKKVRMVYRCGFGSAKVGHSSPGASGLRAINHDQPRLLLWSSSHPSRSPFHSVEGCLFDSPSAPAAPRPCPRFLVSSSAASSCAPCVSDSSSISMVVLPMPKPYAIPYEFGLCFGERPGLGNP